MRYWLLIAVFCLSLAPVFAQGATPYEIAQWRIDEVKRTHSSYLDLSGIGLGTTADASSAIPAEIGELTWIEDLNLNYNQIETLPPEIGNLVNLRAIYIYNSHLRTFPPEIGNLRQLQVITASYNQIEFLPVEIGNLEQLHVLNLNANRLTELPEEMGQLKNLCMLWIADNPISRLPVALGNLSGLLTPENCPAIQEFHLSQEYGLNIDNLPLSYPPQDVLAQGDNAVILYLQNEAWWHLQKLIGAGVGSLALVLTLLLGWRWKNQQNKRKRGFIA